MNSHEAIEWLAMDAGVDRPDVPATNFEAFLRAIPLQDGELGAVFVFGAIGYAIPKIEPDLDGMLIKAFVFGARLARHAMDLELIGQL
jgi:hypothetical protein